MMFALALLDAPHPQGYSGNMVQVSLSLPTELQRHIDSRVATGAFASSSAYLQALVERDKAEYRADVARVQALIDEGLASGVVDRDALTALDDVIAGIPRPNG